MNRMLAIYRREFLYFFNSPVAYVVISVFLLVAGYFFYNLLAYFNVLSIQTMQTPGQTQALSLTNGVVQPLFGNLSIILLSAIPFLTMRLLSEERKSGTAELLFTFPITDWDAVIGKFLATLTVLAVMLAMTVVYPAILFKYSSPEVGPIVSGYLGVFLMGSAFVAMGLFFSSLGDNQVVAAMMTFGCGLLFLLIGWLAPFVSTTTAAVLNELSILGHLESFTRGVFNTNDVLFYVNLTVFFLFLCVRVLDSNRWRS